MTSVTPQDINFCTKTTVEAIANVANTLNSVTASLLRLSTSGRRVSISTPTLTVTRTAHESRILVFTVATGTAVTLPAATGSGDVYEFIFLVDISGGSTVISTPSGTTYRGTIVNITAADGTMRGYRAVNPNNRITLNGTTTGGIQTTSIRFIDQATGGYFVDGQVLSSGSPASPFSTV